MQIHGSFFWDLLIVCCLSMRSFSAPLIIHSAALGKSRYIYHLLIRNGIFQIFFGGKNSEVSMCPFDLCHLRGVLSRRVGGLEEDDWSHGSDQPCGQCKNLSCLGYIGDCTIHS